MKVAFVVKSLDSRGGGAERVLAQVSGGLVQRGHDVAVVTFDSPGALDFYDIDGRIKRLWLGAGRPGTRTGFRDAAKRIWALRQCMKSLNPDVAVGFMHSAYVPLAFALMGSPIPLIASEHIVFDHYKRFPLEGTLLRATARMYTRMTIISKAVRRTFPNRIASRMVIIPNPIACAPNRRADPIGPLPKILLSVGRLTEQKDHATLIQAFKRISVKHPQWRLRIIGEGSLRRQLEELVDEYGLKESIALPGAIQDIEKEYSRAQLFAMPSRYESFGIATAEALNFGLPAIGFADCPGTNELIQHNVNGLLVEGVERTEAFALALDVLMSSDELRRRMGSAAPATVACFALNSIVEKWEGLLRTIASK